MPPTMNGAVTTRGTATASVTTSQQQPEPPSRSVFRLQPPPRQTTTSPLEENINSSHSQLPTTNGAVTTRDSVTNSDYDEEKEQEEDEMDEEGVDHDGLEHDLKAEKDTLDVQHDQQQQPVKLPPYPGLRGPPVEPLPHRELPEVPPLELRDNMLYGYDFHVWRILTGTIEGYYRGAWPGWSFIPRDVTKQMFETFKTIEKGRKPKRVEIYARTHQRKDGTFPSGRTAITIVSLV
ncbi:Transposase, Ptta/En/Spm, plant [Corchorus capsularis]|uniref:Transposase, Ptta/En/Spm, plant n=1 Tax=Corchorus capsularis TaxID=210143 RepID=A0A1R3JMD0_COCAP|nr:Transposase, Ptta/En/Spm, plant [Corchorus capsularis]